MASAPDEKPPESTSYATSRPETGSIAHAIHLLLEKGGLDEKDTRRLVGAKAFMEAPTERLADIAEHASNVGEVLGGYYMQGMDPPSEVDAMNRHFQMQLCMHYMATVENMLAQEPPDLPGIQHAMRFAIDIATTFSRGYQDDTLLTRALELQKQVK